jgi:hypothetical protein
MVALPGDADGETSDERRDQERKPALKRWFLSGTRRLFRSIAGSRASL